MRDLRDISARFIWGETEKEEGERKAILSKPFEKRRSEIEGEEERERAKRKTEGIKIYLP